MPRPPILHEPKILTINLDGIEHAYLEKQGNKSQYIRNLIRLDMGGALEVRLRMSERHNKVCLGASRAEKFGYWEKKMKDFPGHAFSSVDECIDWLEAHRGD